MQLSNSLLAIKRLDKHLANHYEIKDPSVVQIADGSYVMYASIGNSITQQWLVGRFSAQHLTDEWQELEPVEFVDLSGPQLCAPAVTYQAHNGHQHWEMYIQTACFEEGGQIVFATSEDGQHFYGQPTPLVTKDNLHSTSPVVGVYDVGISEIRLNNQEMLCMLYSGYRKVGCGDIYASYKSKLDPSSLWSPGERLIAQEDVPFHNHPDYEFFEWGLEGAKLLQLAEDCYLIIGVCFMPKPNTFLGQRQRVFMAAANSLSGPFQPIGFPFAPIYNEAHSGENGHPDTVLEPDKIWVIYQERLGNGKPWHLRIACLDRANMQAFITGKLATSFPNTLPLSITPDSYHFNYAAV